MSDPEGAGKYPVENQQPVQGQVIGDNNVVHQYFDSASNSPLLAPPLRAWNVPFSGNPFFTGREAVLAQIRACFQTGHAAALSQPQAMSGLGGIGKTQIAMCAASSADIERNEVAGTDGMFHAHLAYPHPRKRKATRACEEGHVGGSHQSFEWSVQDVYGERYTASILVLTGLFWGPNER